MLSGQTMAGEMKFFRLRSLARFVCFLVTAAAASNAAAATLPPGFTETLVSSGLSSPTAMAFAPDGRLFVCEQGGNLRVIKNGALLPTPFATLTVNASGERGLLGVVFDPDFTVNRFVYVYYTATTRGTPPVANIHNRVSRFTANGDVAAAGSEVILLELPTLGATNHNGGALNVGPDGKLYVAVGDNAVGSNAQSLNTPLGKILRINPDGTVPADNPFYNTPGANTAIWARGLRNPFTFAFNAAGTRMFINDVGESTWEEIDDGIAGANYGWPNVEGPDPPDQPFTYPRYTYDHASTSGCAIIGGAFYDQPVVQFPSSYAGDYFFADLCAGWIRKLDPSTNQVVNFASGINLPVDLKVGADGALYYLARGSGSVFRVASTTTADSVTPSSGTGASQTFALRYSDAGGPGNLATLVAWFNATSPASTMSSCFAYYETSSQLVFLLNDAATAWMSGTRGSNNVIQNSQCAIQLASTTVTGSSTTLTLNLPVTFKAAYAGAKTTFMLAGNRNGTSSGWQTRGTWTVVGGAGVPGADAVTPASGSGAAQTFALRYSDNAGVADLATTWVWFTTTLPSVTANSCLAYYEPATERLYLVNDAGSTWLWGLRGSAGTLQNSQCAINLAATTVTAGGNTLTLNLRVTFKAAFAGSKWIFMYAAGSGGANSDWQARGTWTVTAAVVTVGAVTPASGSGAAQTFALQYSDSAGFADLATTWVWFTTAVGSAAATCVMYYEPATDRVYLANDAGSTWLWGLRGGAGTVQNSQCAISLAATDVTAGGNTLTLNLAVSFKPAFAGAKTVFMYAAAKGGVNSDWQARGTWTVTAEVVTAKVVFQASRDHATLVMSYRLDLFANGANPSTARPLATSDLGKPAPDVNGDITVDRSALFSSFAPGAYIATVSAIGAGGENRSTAFSFVR